MFAILAQVHLNARKARIAGRKVSEIDGATLLRSAPMVTNNSVLLVKGIKTIRQAGELITAVSLPERAAPVQ